MSGGWPLEWLPAAWLVGWTLLHFLWQAGAVAVVAALVLSAVDRKGASARYAVCCAALGLMILAPVVTVLHLSEPSGAELSPVGVAGVLGGAVVAEGLRARLALMVPLLSVGWIVGVVLMQARLLWQFLVARRLRSDGLEALPQRWIATVGTLAERVGLRHGVAAFASTRAAVPMVVGLLRPVVLVPTAALTGLPPEQLRAVLAHELAHVRRHDALVNLVQTVFECLFFFHPAVWWLSNRLRVEREFCCDDVAVATCGDRLTYARALAALDDLRPAPVPVLAATGGSLMQRISRLLDGGAGSDRRVGGWLVPAIMTLSLTAMVSALTVTPDDEVAADPDAALKRIDLVKVVSKVDPEHGKVLAVLREAGMDDGVLLELVTRMGTDPRVLDAIQGATEQAEAREQLKTMKLELVRSAELIERDVKAGILTPEEANLRMKRLHTEVKPQLEGLAAKAGYARRKAHPEHKNVLLHRVELDKAKMHEHMQLLELKMIEMKQAAASGRVSKAEAVEAMKQLELQLKQMQEQRKIIDLSREADAHVEHDGSIKPGTWSVEYKLRSAEGEGGNQFTVLEHPQGLHENKLLPMLPEGEDVSLGWTYEAPVDADLHELELVELEPGIGVGVGLGAGVGVEYRVHERAAHGGNVFMVNRPVRVGEVSHDDLLHDDASGEHHPVHDLWTEEDPHGGEWVVDPSLHEGGHEHEHTDLLPHDAHHGDTFIEVEPHGHGHDDLLGNEVTDFTFEAPLRVRMVESLPRQQVLPDAPPSTVNLELIQAHLDVARESGLMDQAYMETVVALLRQDREREVALQMLEPAEPVEPIQFLGEIELVDEPEVIEEIVEEPVEEELAELGYIR